MLENRAIDVIRVTDIYRTSCANAGILYQGEITQRGTNYRIYVFKGLVVIYSDTGISPNLQPVYSKKSASRSLTNLSQEEEQQSSGQSPNLKKK